MKLQTLSFFYNRPTLGALMAIGNDVSVTGSSKPPDARVTIATVVVGKHVNNDGDVQVHVKLQTLSFFCNRPTLGALMAIGDDVSATGTSKPPDAPAAAVQQPTPTEDQGGQAALDTAESGLTTGLLSDVFARDCLLCTNCVG